MSWSRPPPCGPQTGAAAIPPPSSHSAAAPPTGKLTAPSPTDPPAPAGPAVPSGSVGVPIRLADPTALTLVHPGNRVDLLRLDDAGAVTAVAASALVLNVTGATDPTTGGLLLALTPAEAQRAVPDPDHGFAILIRPG